VSAPSDRRPPIAAAGGVVWRQDGDDLLVSLVHRPRYQDWTLPKGKPRADEQLLRAAVREVAEETGAVVEVGRRLAPVEYPLSDGGRKRVSHWTMRYLQGEHQPGPEVDAIRWLTVAEAAHRLTYPIDRAVLADFARIPVTTTTVLLMRHAKAGKRSHYPGDDRLRPLDRIGRRHARESVAMLACFRPQRILSADRVRCQQTVQPLADFLGLQVDSAPEFSDEGYLEDPAKSAAALGALADEPGTSLVCSQGEAIPGLLSDLLAVSNVSVDKLNARKGSVWALSLVAQRLVAADYYPHPNS
jgi:phosphohistidine phosphatase SixA/ADP-ribose pyrophosphatase YjhB (NUDIX family)